MTLADFFQLLAINLMGRIPYIVVFVICIVIALRRRQRHPKVSKWAIIGFTLHLLNQLFSTAHKILMLEVSVRGWTITQQITLDSVYGLAQLIIQVVGYAYLLAAIFGYRNTHSSDQSEPES